jgi:hypothetical protein
MATLLGSGATAMLAAIAALGQRGNFWMTFLYVSCTALVATCATAVTIRGAARLGKRRPGAGDAPGFIEAGLLIGLFVVSPLALSGAFIILDALVGSL